MTRIPRPVDAVSVMKPYVPGYQAVDSHVLKLNTNENPYPPSPAVKQALADFDPSSLRLYPDPGSEALAGAYADVYGINKNNVMAGNGSDECLSLLFRAFVDHKTRIYSFDPTYTLYDVLAAERGVEITKIPFGKDFSLPSEFRFRDDIDVLVITDPNAPSGTSFDRSFISYACDAADLVILDQAYADFADGPKFDLIAEHPNLAIIHTLSKSWSLAGLRTGFAAGQPSVIEPLKKIRDSYNVDRLAQVLAAAALTDTQWMLKNVQKIIAARQRFISSIRTSGFKVTDSSANFVLVEVQNAAHVHRLLEKQGILVRYFNHAGLENYLRVTIGTGPQMRRTALELQAACK